MKVVDGSSLCVYFVSASASLLAGAVQLDAWDIDVINLQTEVGKSATEKLALHQD